MITSRPSCRPRFSADLATFTASFPPSTTGTPISSPSATSCSMAAGRLRSAATSIGCRPFSLRWTASFAHVVVFPEPCTPAIMIAAGFPPGTTKGRSRPPSVPVISSLTIFTTC